MNNFLDIGFLIFGVWYCRVDIFGLQNHPISQSCNAAIREAVAGCKLRVGCSASEISISAIIYTNNQKNIFKINFQSIKVIIRDTGFLKKLKYQLGNIIHQKPWLAKQKISFLCKLLYYWQKSCIIYQKSSISVWFICFSWIKSETFHYSPSW